MTAQPQDFPAGGTAMPEKGLRAIRAALVVPQDHDAFDSGLKAVLDEVRVTLDLGVLNDFVHRWWISACDSVTDPRGAPADAYLGRADSGRRDGFLRAAMAGDPRRAGG